MTRSLLGALLATSMLASGLAAQSDSVRAARPDSVRAAVPVTRDSTPVIPDHQLFHRSDLYVAAAFVAGTIALLPAERHLTAVIRDEDLLNSSTVQHLADAGTFFGGPGPLLIGGTMYVVGRFGHVPKMAELAVHGGEAVFVGATIATVIKDAAGRARPYATADTNAHDFSLGRGLKGGDYKSFPSGHATAAFSAAAAVVAETHEWWPQSTWYVAPLMYGGATMVGVSRIYNNQHWASDVLMGAAIGTFAGLKTVRFNHTHTGNKIDRILLGARLVPTSNGPAVAYAMTF